MSEGPEMDAAVVASSTSLRSFRCVDDAPLYKGADPPPLQKGSIYPGIVSAKRMVRVTVTYDGGKMVQHQFSLDRFEEVPT